MSDHYTARTKVSFPHFTLTFCWRHEKKSSPVMTSENYAFPANLHAHVSHKLNKVSPHRNLTWRVNTPPSVLTKHDRSVYLYRWNFHKDICHKTTYCRNQSLWELEEPVDLFNALQPELVCNKPTAVTSWLHKISLNALLFLFWCQQGTHNSTLNSTLQIQQESPSNILYYCNSISSAIFGERLW